MNEAAGPSTEPSALRLSVGLTAHRDLRPEQEPHLRAQVRDFFRACGRLPRPAACG
jgi:hypothetical protein